MERRDKVLALKPAIKMNSKLFYLMLLTQFFSVSSKKVAPFTDEEKEERLKKPVTTSVIFPLSWFPQNTGQLVFDLKE